MASSTAIESYSDFLDGFERLEKPEGVEEGEDLVRLYLNEIGRYPLLTKDEEQELAQTIERGRVAEQQLLEAAEAGKRIRAIRARALRSDVKDGETAWKTFYNCNLRLVVSIAKKYNGDGHDLDLLDLVQEGNTGLIKAVDKFDWRKGFKFSTYATWWIRQAIPRAIINQGRSIRLPLHVAEGSRDVRRAHGVLEAMLYGAQPTNEEIAAYIGKTVKKVAEYQFASASTEVISLDTPTGLEGKDTLNDTVHDLSVSGPTEEVERDSVLAAIFANLDQKFKYIDEVQADEPDRQLKKLVGTNTGEMLRLRLEGYTYKAICELYEISEERARKRCNIALTWLRNSFTPEERETLSDAINS